MNDTDPFSNYDSDIFVIQTPKQVDRGALMARYSRSNKSMRDIYKEEFEPNENRGKEFYDRVFASYGDDSVAELGYAQIAVENISNIAAQFIEDSRIGLSYLEKSSRYVKMDKFYTPVNISTLFYDIYTDTCKESLKVYNKACTQIDKYLREKFPEESLDYENVKNPKLVYNSVIKAKMLDITRGLLPASIHTNLGISGNARSFEYLILKMKSSDISEINMLGSKIYDELQKTISPFLTRVNSPYGIKQQMYMKNLKKNVEVLLNKHITEISEPSEKSIGQDDMYYKNYVRCIESDVQLIAETNILTALFYECVDTNISYEAIRQWIMKLTITQRRKLLIQIMQTLRENRRFKLPRAFENSMWRFEIISSYAVYRDLHRHRLLTFHRQKFNPSLGYYIPDEISDISMHKEFVDVMYNSINAYNKIYKTLPNEAQYVLNFAFNYRYQIYVNFRELSHIIELRTTPQGNPEYRIICQKMFEEIRKTSKFLSSFINFVDTKEYPLERLKAEIRTDKKLNS